VENATAVASRLVFVPGDINNVAHATAKALITIKLVMFATELKK